MQSLGKGLKTVPLFPKHLAVTWGHSGSPFLWWRRKEKVRKTLTLRLFLYKYAKGLYLGRYCFLRSSTSMGRHLLAMREPSRRRRAEIRHLELHGGATGNVQRKPPTAHQHLFVEMLHFLHGYIVGTHKVVPQGVPVDMWSWWSGLREDPSKPCPLYLDSPTGAGKDLICFKTRSPKDHSHLPFSQRKVIVYQSAFT